MSNKTQELTTAKENSVKTNIVAGAEVSFLNKNLNVIFEKKDDTIELMILPDMNDKGTGVTISELVTAIVNIYTKAGGGAAGISEDDVTGSFKDIFKNFGKNVMIDLNMIFLHVVKSINKTPAVCTIEYAFKLSVQADFGDAIKDLFDFKSVYIAIWNTENKKIISDMKLGSINELLEN